MKLQHFVTRQLERNDDLQDENLQKEVINKGLKEREQRYQQQVKDYEQLVQELGEARDATETQRAKMEQDLQLTVKVHAREQEESKKEFEKFKEEKAEEMRKLQSLLEEKTKEHEALSAKWDSFLAWYHNPIVRSGESI